VELERLSVRELCEGNLEGSTFTGDPKDYAEEGSGDGHFWPYGSRWGTWKGLFTMDFNRWVKVALELELRSLREFCDGNVGEGNSTGKPRRKRQVRLLK
jgi:hypothetical protein